ncbi:E3 ubiquitin-protein ligase TRIM39-like [Pleurodeles waltl]|uniref:E3 ubiquitin-protein ligase TRIM39-like n=1 Tax=Pleurodeles waltl TaxID=8319 RepID=UPI0037093D03
MATADQSRKLEDEATCSICLEYFKDPVIIACGHNFCQSCISRCWQEVNTNFACPQCRATSQERSFRPNRQLGNLVEMLKLHLPSLKSQEHVCEKHQQRLQLFCEDDQEPICVVCDRSRDHRSHTVVPVEEAAQEYKTKLQNSLTQMKKDLEDVKRLATEENKNETDLEGDFQSQMKRIFSTFEELQQFLEQEKQDLLGKLEVEHKKNLEKIHVKQTDLEKQNSSFMVQITEMEEKCQQEDLEFLKGIKSLLNSHCIKPRKGASYSGRTKRSVRNRYTQKVQLSRPFIEKKMGACETNVTETKWIPVSIINSTSNEQSLQNSCSLEADVLEKIKNLKEKLPLELERIYCKNFEVLPTLEQDKIHTVTPFQSDDMYFSGILQFDPVNNYV